MRIMDKEEKNTRLIPEKLQFLADLGRTSAWITGHYSKFLKPYGISTQQFNVLRVLRTVNDCIPMNKVNELLIIRSPNITRLIDKLVSKQLVIRKREETDRRLVYVKITGKGLELLAKIDNEHEGELSDYMDSFTKEEAVMMTAVLKKIRS